MPRLQKMRRWGIRGAGIVLLLALLGACTPHRLQPVALPERTLLPRPPAENLPREVGEALIRSATGIDEETYPLVYAMMAGGESPLVAGNAVELLIDGPPTFAAMVEAIAGAQHHVHLETYIFADDALGALLQKALIAQARKGVQVRVIYDALGSYHTPATFFEAMGDAGIEVAAYRPLSVFNVLPWRINNRDHRKLLVVDGATAFTGGINIMASYTSSSWSNPGRKDLMLDGWRDTHVKIEGPAAALFQGYFLETWSRLNKTPVGEAEKLYPRIDTRGNHLVGAIASRGDEKKAETYAAYMAAITHASESIYLMNAYFIPNKAMVEALQQAVARGVEVVLMVPAFTDSNLAIAASQAAYGTLLKAGVKIYEREGALLHAKTATIDGVVSIVGSANLDMRSFLHNNEISAVVVSQAFAREMREVFERDLLSSRRISWEAWRERPFLDKIKETFGTLFSYWL